MSNRAGSYEVKFIIRCVRGHHYIVGCKVRQKGYCVNCSANCDFRHSPINSIPDKKGGHYD